MTKEYYWHAQLPSGDWAVLRYTPSDNAHRVVAMTPSKERAEFYAAMDNDLLDADEAIDAPDPPQPAKSLPVDDPARIGVREGSDAVMNDLPALFAEFPQGFNTDIIRERYGYTYNSALDILRFLHAIGSGRFIHKSGKGGSKIFVAPDSDITETELTQNQSAVLTALIALADQYGVVAPRLTDIAMAADIATGSVPSVLMALEKKQLIMLAKPGGAYGPATYQIIEKARA